MVKFSTRENCKNSAHTEFKSTHVGNDDRNGRHGKLVRFCPECGSIEVPQKDTVQK